MCYCTMICSFVTSFDNFAIALYLGLMSMYFRSRSTVTMHMNCSRVSHGTDTTFTQWIDQIVHDEVDKEQRCCNQQPRCHRFTPELGPGLLGQEPSSAQRSLLLSQLGERLLLSPRAPLEPVAVDSRGILGITGRVGGGTDAAGVSSRSGARYGTPRGAVTGTFRAPRCHLISAKQILSPRSLARSNTPSQQRSSRVSSRVSWTSQSKCCSPSGMQCQNQNPNSKEHRSRKEDMAPKRYGSQQRLGILRGAFRTQAKRYGQSRTHHWQMQWKCCTLEHWWALCVCVGVCVCVFFLLHNLFWSLQVGERPSWFLLNHGS